MAASIRQLSKRTASAIQAGVVVPKLDRIIIELVQNSLDAQSTGIDITLQHDNTSLTIADNGHGITFADLKTVGSAACSSKQNPLQSSQPTFGFRGQALHSIQAYAVLTIESRDPKTLRCYRKCLYEGATLSFEPMDHRIIGTRITLSNIYGNFPVRHRQLAQFKLPPTLIALANLLFAQKRGKVTMIAKGDAIYRTVLEYHSDLQFMCAQLEDATWRAHLFPVDGMHPVFKIGGIIANQGHTTASHQYIAVNGRPIHSSFVHDHVRQQFQKSLLGRVSEYQGGKLLRTRSPAHHPVFAFHISCNPHLLDITLEPSKTTALFSNTTELEQALDDVVIKFLDTHLLRALSVATDIATSSPKRMAETSNSLSVDSVKPAKKVSPVKRFLLTKARAAEAAPQESDIAVKLRHVVQCDETTEDGNDSGDDDDDMAWQGQMPKLAPIAKPKTGKLTRFKFDSKIFETLQLHGQVDNKFILCSIWLDSRRLLCAFDQHAVHERVRLEDLENVCYHTKDARQMVEFRSLSEPYLLDLDARERRLSEKNADLLVHHGLKYSRTDEGIAITALPLALLPFEDSDSSTRTLSTSPVKLKYIIKALLVEPTRTWNIPPLIQDVLNTRACHGAIKFGDTLSRKDQTNLLDQLSACKFPFQCAHGRPSLYPLVDLTSASARTNE